MPFKPNQLVAFREYCCYKVQWQTDNTGNCAVDYIVELKDAKGAVQYSEVLSTKSAKMAFILFCGSKSMNITNASVTVKTFNGYQSYSVYSLNVSPTTLQSPTSKYDYSCFNNLH